MLGIRYLKVPATTYVLHYKAVRFVKHGRAFVFYFAPTSVIAQVPISSVDVPFAFTETSSDFQDVTVQGSLTTASRSQPDWPALLDYTVNVRGRYESEDPSKLGNG